MKTKIVLNRWGWLLAIKVGLAIIASAAVAMAADDSQPTSGNFTEKMKDWEEKMSQAFHDTWQGLWQDKDARNLGESTLAIASVDLREQQNSYTVRLNLPNRDLDKVAINLSGDTLHIVAPADGKSGRYEQDIHLEGVAANATPKIERMAKDDQIVVTVAKSADLAGTKPVLTPGPTPDPWDAWDRDVLERMDNMQREMDGIFNQAFSEFRSIPQFNDVFNQARFDSSFAVQEEGNNYVVRAYLPDRDMNNVNVTTDGQILKIEAREEKTQQGGTGNVTSSQMAQYSQMLTLPGPVQIGKMTVDRKENMLVITLPKA